MKVKKSVNEKGRIEMEITPPVYPAYTFFQGSHYNLDQSSMSPAHWLIVDKITLGDYTYKHLAPHLTYGDAADAIAAKLSDMHTEFCAGYAEFCARHTESAEIVDKPAILEKLVEKDRLYYRNQAGQIKKLDV